MLRAHKKKSGSDLVNYFSHLFIPQRSNNYRSKLLHSDSLIYLAFVSIGFFAFVQTVKFFPGLHNRVLGFDSNITAEKVIEQTNQQRMNSGLRPLIVNQKLSAAALAKAQDMLDDQYWAHVSPDGRQPWDFIKEANYTYRVAGENLARDFHDTESMMQAWMSSPTHKANVLNDKYEQIGIAVVDGKLEGFETTLVVQMFGTPQVAQMKTVSSETPSANKIDETAVLADQASALEEEHKPVFAIDEPVETQEKTEPVLANAMAPINNLSSSPIFTPLQLTKAFFLGIIMLIVLTLVYDSFIIGNRKTMRLVGQNFAHILLFSCVAFLLIFFKGGMIK